MSPKTLACLLALLPLAACSPGPELAVLSPERGTIRESFSEPARTRLAETYRITLPITGRIARIDLKPGDRVEKGQALASYDREPFEQAVAEARAALAELEQQRVLNRYDAIEETLAVEMEATVDAARDALAASAAQVEAEGKRSARAQKEQRRMQALAEQQSISEQALDDAALSAETALIELRREELIQAALNTLFTAIKLGPRYVREWLGRKRIQGQVVEEQIAQARARLALAERDLRLTQVRSPIDGVVLERLDPGDATLAAGTPLLLLGDPADLEVVAEVLTTDALRLSPGTPVALTTAGHLQPLEGQVQRIEPAGFTKLSSLGVEQQRVNVIVALHDPPPALGVGYRLQARFYTGERQDALIVPRYAVLQAPDQTRYVFEVQDGRLVRQTVQLGLGNDTQVEVTEGLDADDTLVATPDTTLKDGQGVTAVRQAAP
jgi:HlyD family secretion protein